MSLLIPNTELVAVSWIKGIPGIPVSSVSTTLPSDNTTWSASGFIQVPFVVGGSPDIFLAEQGAAEQRVHQRRQNEVRQVEVPVG